MTGRQTKTGYFSRVKQQNLCGFSHCCLCVEKAIPIDNQVIHADVTCTGTNITSTSSPLFCSPSPLPLSLFPYHDFFPSLFLSLSVSLCPLRSIFLRLAKFRQIPRGPDRYLGRSCIVCLPGHRGAQTQDHLDEERQESQLPALWGEHSCVTFRSLNTLIHTQSTYINTGRHKYNLWQNFTGFGFGLPL